MLVKKKPKIKFIDYVPVQGQSIITRTTKLLPYLGNTWNIVASHVKAPPLPKQIVNLTHPSAPVWLSTASNKSHPNYGNLSYADTLRSLDRNTKIPRLPLLELIKMRAPRKGYNLQHKYDLIHRYYVPHLNHFNVRSKGMQNKHSAHNDQRTFARLSKAHARAMQSTKPVASNSNKKKALKVISRAVSQKRKGESLEVHPSSSLKNNL
jgi:hypothetical protein